MRRPQGLRRLLGVQAIAAVAQVTGAAQLAALLLVVGTGRSTDAYVTLFTASQLAGSIIVTGTLQPLALSTPHYDRWGTWGAVGSVLNLVAVGATTGLLAALGYPSHDVFVVAALIAVSGVLAVMAGVLAVELALTGAPALLSGLTIAPNALAALFVVASPGDHVAWMCAGLLAGNVLMVGLGVRWKPNRAQLVIEPTSEDSAPSRRDAAGLIGSASVGALGPFGLQAAIASFPAGQATLLGLFSRIGAGLIGVGVTAFSYTTTDWERRSVGPLRAMSRYATLALGVSLVAAIALSLIGGLQDWIAGALACAWVFGSASGATAARALGMEGNYRPFRTMAVISLLLYPLATWGLVVGPQTAASYFAALFAITATANLLFLRALAWDSERAAALAGVGLGVLLLVASLV